MAPPRQACFSDLPPEIKAYIVKFARQQDVAYHSRGQGSKRAGGGFRPPRIKVVWEEYERALYGRQGAQRTRSFSSVRVLKASNCDAAIFKYQILHKYSGYVQELDFDDKHADVLRYLLSIISPHAFPSITRLATSGKVAKSLLGDSVMSWDEDEEVYLRSTFRTLAGRIEALEMRDFGAVEAARFLSYFSRLRSVQLSGVLDLASGDDNPLPAALALHDLRSLSFDKTASFGISCTTATWPFASSLTQFRLRTANLGAGDLRIISVFPPTIEDLSLTFQRLDKSFPPGIDLVIGFSLPLLRNLPLGTLSQGNSTDGAWAILAGLATSPLHSLHYTTYDRPTFKFNSPLVLSLKAR